MEILMKKHLKNLADGNFDIDPPKILSITEKIEGEVTTGGVAAKSLHIKTDKPVTGFCKAGGRKVALSDYTFSGRDIEIQCIADAKAEKPGSFLRGEIHILCEAGSFKIPYTFAVCKNKFETVYGVIGDLNSFARLLARDGKLAKKIFLSDEFEEICIDDPELIDIYRLLKAQQDSDEAMRTFLVIANVIKPKKHLPPKEAEKIENDKNDCLQAEKEDLKSLSDKGLESIWDEAEKYITDKYISFRKKEIEAEEFISSSKEVLKKSRDTFNNNKKDNYTEQEKAAYVAFCMATAVLLVFEGKSREADEIICAYANVVTAFPETKASILFFYAEALVKKERDIGNISAERLSLKKEAKGKNALYALFFLYRLDYDADINESYWLAEFKSSFTESAGFKPILLESADILSKDPGLLRVFNSFESAVLTFAAENGYMTDSLSVRMSEVIDITAAKRSEQLINFLENIYDKNKNDVILTSLVSKLIYAGKAEEKYLPYYSLAIEKNLKITKVYEYYLASHDYEKTYDLPEEVLRYFLLETGLDYRLRAFLYVNVIKLKDIYPEIYSEYEPIINKFTREEMTIKHIDSNLAKLYTRIWAPSYALDSKYAESVFKLEFIKEINVESAAIVGLLIKNKEMKNFSRITLHKGKAFACIMDAASDFDREADLVFIDTSGNLVAPQEVIYSVKKALDVERMDKFAESVKNEPLYLLYALKKAQNKGKTEYIKYAERLLTEGDISDWFRERLTDELKKNISAGDKPLPEEVTLEGEIENIRDKEEKLAEMLYTRRPTQEMKRLFSDLVSVGAKAGTLIFDAYISYQSYVYVKEKQDCDADIFPFIRERLVGGEKVIDIEKLAFLKYTGAESAYLSNDDTKLCMSLLNGFVAKKWFFEFFNDLHEKIKPPVHIADKTIIEYNGSSGSSVYIVEISEGEVYGNINLEESFLGIYAYPLVLFAGDGHRFKIIEKTPAGEVIKEEREIDFTAGKSVVKGSSFDLLCKINVESKKKNRIKLYSDISEYNYKTMINRKIFSDN